MDKPWHDDTHKSAVGVIPPQAIMAIGEVFTSGMDKYGHRNWEEHADDWRWSDLIASTLRHIYKWQMREDLDTESGVHHLAHAMTNLTMLYTLIKVQKGDDDRTNLTISEVPQDGKTVHKHAVWGIQRETFERAASFLPKRDRELLLRHAEEMGGIGPFSEKRDREEDSTE